MDKKELLTALIELQGLKIGLDRAAQMTGPGGAWDMTQIIRSVLFQADVTGARPRDDLRFETEEVKP